MRQKMIDMACFAAGIVLVAAVYAAPIFMKDYKEYE